MKLLDTWNHYWFREGSLFDLAVVRLILVGFQVIWLVTAIPFSLGIATQQPDILYQPLVALQFLTAWTGGGRPSVELMNAIYWIAVVSGVLAFIGLKARLALIVFAATNILLQAYIWSFQDIHHQEGIMMIMLMALAISPSARVLSVDSLLTAKRSKDPVARRPGLDSLLDAKDAFARWPIRLGHFLFAMFYLSAVYSKLSGSGFGWANGYTLQYFLFRDGMKYDLPLGVWFSQHHELVIVLQWFVLVFQATFWLVLVRPQLKWIYVPLGLAFHTGILLTMGAAFQMWMVSYCVFIPWAVIARKLSSRSDRLSTPAMTSR